MSKQSPFDASQFKPTKWDTAEQKAKFANHLVKFLNARCPESMFHQWFYQRLSNTFGHIAHYNRNGFYGEWFTTAQKRLRFIQHLLAHPCWGDTEYTYSDAEAAIQDYVRRTGLEERRAQEAREECQEQNEHAAKSALAALPVAVRRKVAANALIGL